MRGRKKIITVCGLFLTGLLWLCSCGSPSSDSAVETGSELVYVSSMELQYAENFSVDYYEGGYTLLTVKDGTRILVVPEGKDIPGSLEEGVIVMQRPIKNLYLVASAVMDMLMR